MASRKDRERDPLPMGDLLRTLVAGRGWSERMALGELREGWAGIVGPSIALHSEPSSFARGVLTIVAEATWATELTLLGPQIAARTKEHLALERDVEVKVIARGGNPRKHNGGS
ncbi:MAG TPA: DUF721 domain-containing protein [Actinomycetota bacterium]|nr:DUF721 domain-containing protein [Actinomycetota bacterium]